MSIILVGLNHRTAPVTLREKLALPGCALRMALEELQIYSQFASDRTTDNRPIIQEAVILSTCNRLEVYAVARDVVDGTAVVERFLAQLQNIALDELRPHLYLEADAAAVIHLMRVAAGLDSMILGETQVLGQVAQAFSDAQAAGVTGPILSHLFAQAAHLGKRARSETDISRYTTSVSHAAAQLVQEQVSSLSERRVLVVGAGETALLAAQTLQRCGARDIAFINRTFSRAETLAHELDGRALGWYQLGEALDWADVVLCATGAPHTVIYATDVAQIMAQRADRPLLFVDIAVPRDVEDSVGDVPGVQRYDIDDLQSTVDANMAQRKAAVPQVEAIIAQETEVFLDWLNSRRVLPVIDHLRRHVNELAQAEVEKALNRLNGERSPHTEEVIQQLAHRVVNKILHEPTVRLKNHAADGNGYGYAHALSELFGLDNTHADDCTYRSGVCDMPNQKPEMSTVSCNLQCVLTTNRRR